MARCDRGALIQVGVPAARAAQPVEGDPGTAPFPQRRLLGYAQGMLVRQVRQSQVRQSAVWGYAVAVLVRAAGVAEPAAHPDELVILVLARRATYEDDDQPHGERL